MHFIREYIREYIREMAADYFEKSIITNESNLNFSRVSI